MASYNFAIHSVKNKKDLNQFIFLPWQIFRNDPHWVPPLKKDVKFKLDRAKHPFFEHAEMKLFLAYQDTKPIGRIAAIIDHRYNEYHNEQTGFFGMFECIQDYDVAKSLFSAAEIWCKDKGMNRLRGPMNLSMNDECAFLLEGLILIRLSGCLIILNTILSSVSAVALLRQKTCMPI